MFNTQFDTSKNIHQKIRLISIKLDIPRQSRLLYEGPTSSGANDYEVN